MQPKSLVVVVVLRRRRSANDDCLLDLDRLNPSLNCNTIPSSSKESSSRTSDSFQPRDKHSYCTARLKSYRLSTLKGAARRRRQSSGYCQVERPKCE